MNDFRLFYSSDYYADIGEDHVFPIRKFELARDILLNERTLRREEIVEPQPALPEDILLVHTRDYLQRISSGSLSAAEVRKLGLPWSEALVRRSMLAVSGTINAAKHALSVGVSSNLAGGTHHAFPDRGEGFCVLNDVAVAIRVLKRDRLAHRFLIIDLDVHQGNGTAFIFRDDKSVFTFSMHGAKNYPLFKENSDLDIELPDGTEDDDYLRTLEGVLPQITRHRPDLIFYLGGADPFADDKLGRLGLTKNGLRIRDERVLEFAKSAQIPIATVMSGGYAKDMNDTVDIHCNTIRTVKQVFGSRITRAAI